MRFILHNHSLRFFLLQNRSVSSKSGVIILCNFLMESLEPSRGPWSQSSTLSTEARTGHLQM